MWNNQDQYGQRGTYEQQQEMNQQKQNEQQDVLNAPIKTTIITEDVKEMVRLLNKSPFNENYSLVTFDELTSSELLDLLNKILALLDSQFSSIKEKPQDQIVFEVVSFLKVLSYPVPEQSPQDVNWQNGLFNAERRIIYPVLFYLVTRYADMKKRAYLAKYLVPYSLPENVVMDEEIKKYTDEYKDLQAEFSVIHQQLESQEKESMNPDEVKKEIAQLQQEREQLLSKINVFKGKNTANPKFQALLEVTNLLRKEQEEENRIQDKLRQQRAHLEWTDQQLLASQQRLFDAKKSVAPENTPEQMLMSLRNEVKKNRELCNERFAVEIGEKRKKLEQSEKLLSDPPITQNELQQMEANLMNLRRNVNIMEDKIAKQTNPDKDKLAIFKQQATLVTKKKERAMEEQKRAEQEMETLNKEIKAKEEKLNKERGPGFSNDEFKNFVEQLKVKHTKYKKLNKELTDIKSEISLLQRTEDILKDQKSSYYKLLQKAEQDKGITGAFDAQQKLNQVSEQQQDTNEKKGQTLEEISKFVIEIKKILDQKKAHLQPQIKVLKELREEFKELEQDHKRKKGDYDKVMVGSESEISTLENEVKKYKDELDKEEKKMIELKENSVKLSDKLQKLSDEIDFQKGHKQLSSEHKTYVAFFEAKATKLEQEVKDLRSQREVVKDNYEPSQRQIQMFSDLKILLKAKLDFAKRTGGSQKANINYKNQGGNVNTLVIDN